MRRTLALLTAVITVGSGLLLSGGVAAADPSAAAWESLRQCESTGRYDINTGNGYYGAYQFDLSTWRSVGGTGYPHQASPTEQDYRALYLYRMRGWQPWTCATIRGLAEDRDARSGVVPPYPGAVPPTPAPTPAPTPPPTPGPAGAPAYPGHAFSEGDSSDALVAWQKQMGSRGYGLTGTGYFGPLTLGVVQRLQRESGIAVDGIIRQATWYAAWTSPVAPTPPPVAGDACPLGATVAPPWPGEQYNLGDTSAELRCWQKQMGTRGYGLVGTGYYGPATAAVVIGVQRRNGLNPSGILGPQTWVAAWEGE